MLVLTRKRDEVIKIGSDIVIRVIKTGKTTVKIGIEAPASVRVMRGELATHGGEFNLEMESATDEEMSVESLLEAVLVQC